jgi:hypothetical protein
MIRQIIVGLAMALSCVSSEAQIEIKVGPNVHVSSDNAKLAHGEVLVAADPTHPGWLVGCSMIFPDPLTRRLSDGVTYTSQDGGAHWTQTLYAGNGPMSTGDPACGFGPDGKAYSVYLLPAVKPEMDDVEVYRSPDGGKTWSAPSHIDWIDREYITVDATGGKYNGRIYVNGTGSGRLMDPPSSADAINSTLIGISLQRSLDGGATFRPAIKQMSSPAHWVLGMGNGVILSDGTYIAVFGEQQDRSEMMQKRPAKADAWLKMISSTDGGESYSKASVISDWFMNYGDISGTSSIVPVMAVDRSNGPFRDRLYVVWPDYRSGRGEIFFSYSSDKGKTWAKPRTVNDDRAWPAPAQGPDDGMPMLDVNRNGIVGVAWYDRRDSPRNYGWKVRFAASNDGGETFSSSVVVSEAPATIRLAGKLDLQASSYGGGKPFTRQKGGNLQVNVLYGTLFSFNGGHTAGMAADADGSFHPFWIDNRTGVEQIWSSAIAVTGKSTRNGAESLSEWKDASDRVTLDFRNCVFDAATGTVSLDAYLTNTSDQPLSFPVKIRVLSLDSKLGEPSVSNADNHVSASGAMWDFGPDLAKGKAQLAAGETTAAKTLTFHLKGVQLSPEPPSPEDLHRFISFEAKALSR